VTNSIHINLDQAGLNHVLKAPTGPVQTFMRRTAEKTADEARRRAPVVSGRLKNSIVVNRGPLGSWEVTATAPYAYVVHQGTGKKSVAPVRIRKGGGVRITVRKKTSGLGAKGQPFLMDALQDVVGSLL
jgi:hypothetical protein